MADVDHHVKRKKVVKGCGTVRMGCKEVVRGEEHEIETNDGKRSIK